MRRLYFVACLFKIGLIVRDLFAAVAFVLMKQMDVRTTAPLELLQESHACTSHWHVLPMSAGIPYL